MLLVYCAALDLTSILDRKCHVCPEDSGDKRRARISTNHFVHQKKNVWSVYACPPGLSGWTVSTEEEKEEQLFGYKKMTGKHFDVGPLDFNVVALIGRFAGGKE